MLHNRYRAQGGEERAVSDIEDLLRRHGHEVRLIERSSVEASRWRAGAGMLAGGLDPDAVGAAVRDLQADVLHVHNVHPLFGWRALAAAQANGARTVFHVHNFRLFCAISVSYYDGEPCYRCRGRNTWPGLRLRCRGSLTEAATYAVGLSRQQPRLFEHTDRFVVLSQAHGARLKELGLPGDRATTLPNFVPEANLATASGAGEGRHALVSGRLVPEKGFDTAVAAARAAGVPLVVAGEGPDAGRLRELAGDAEVTFTGRLTPERLAEVRRQAGVVLVPSRCEEACPYSVLDALADGIPVLASDRGGLPEMVDPDAVLPAEDAQAWGEGLRRLWADPESRAQAGASALDRARSQFAERAYYDRLVEVYG
jgi:glycosyltransferase involved in cell wall biosynthesis